MKFNCSQKVFCFSSGLSLLIILCIILHTLNNVHDRGITVKKKDFHATRQTVPPLCSDGEIPLSVNYKELDLRTLGDEVSGSNLVKSDEEYIAALLNWTKPNRNSTCISKSSMMAFGTFGKQVGDVWSLYEGQKGELSHNRHEPPSYSGIQALIFHLLQNFHSRPFLQTRFEPRGGFAIIRAAGGDLIDIHFRFHAEFQLNEKPLLPFWFTPAYFTGNIVLNTKTKDVLEFHLYVPNTNELNVDLEWYGSNRPDDNLMVDIGYLPAMELNTDPYLGELNHEWSDEITIKDAQRKLEKAFFPFKEVDYIPFEEAIQKAREQRSGRTLREGPLASPPIMNFLQKHFISSWSLVAKLKKLSHSNDSSIAKLASDTLDAYSFPVEIIIYDQRQNIVHYENLNMLFEEEIPANVDLNGFDDTLSYRYANMLRRAMAAMGRDITEL